MTKTILLLDVLSAILVGFGSLLSPSMFYAMTATPSKLALASRV